MRRPEPGVLAVLVVGLLLTPGLARSQSDPVVIDHADELNRTFRGDSLTYVLSGNVRAHRGPLYMRSQRAVIYRNSGVADFTRDVHFWDREKEIYADHVVYDEATDVAVASGEVQVIDKETGSNVSSDTVRYDRTRGLVRAWPRPHAVIMSSDSAAAREPFDVWADTMRLVSDSVSNAFVGLGRVLIERSDLTAVGDSVHYDETTGMVALRNHPRVETAETYLTAETIDVRFADDELDALVAVGDAHAVQKGDSVPAAVPRAFGGLPETSFLDGDSLYMAFTAEALDWLASEGNARSLTFKRESPDGPVETWSVNYLLAERIRLNFIGDTLQVVTATNQRGINDTREIRIGGPRRLPSEPIPLAPITAERTATAPRRSRKETARG